MSRNRRHQVVRSAAALFRKRGFKGATIRELAEAVDLQSGSLFHYFDSKQDILFAVVSDALEVSIERMHTVLAQVSTPRERLRALILAELEAILGQTRDGMTVATFEWGNLSAPHQEAVNKLRSTYEGIWSGVLKEAATAGLLPLENVFILRRFLTGALSWTVTWYRLDGPVNLEGLADMALRLVIK